MSSKLPGRYTFGDGGISSIGGYIFGENDIAKWMRDYTGKKRPIIYNEENLQMANELGYKTIFWSLAYVDWHKNNQPTKEEAFSKLLPRVHNGAILLLHSTSKTNAIILDELLTKLENEGYSFGSLDELVL